MLLIIYHSSLKIWVVSHSSVKSSVKTSVFPHSSVKTSVFSSHCFYFFSVSEESQVLPRCEKKGNPKVLLTFLKKVM